MHHALACMHACTGSKILKECVLILWFHIIRVFIIESTITTRLKYIISEYNGITDRMEIGQNVENMLAKDSLALRNEITRVSPDIELAQEVEFPGGDTVEVNIPLTTEFFWPKL